MAQGVRGTVSTDASGRCAAQLDIQEIGVTDFGTDGRRAWVKGVFLDRMWEHHRRPELQGKYLTGPVENNPFNSFTLFCGAVRASALEGTDIGDMTEQESRSSDGVRTTSFITQDGGVVEVTDAGSNPQMSLRRSGRDDSDPFEYLFSDYGRPVELSSPPSDMSVDVNVAPGFG